MATETLTLVCALCHDEHRLDTQGLKTREQVATRYHFQIHGDELHCAKCTLTPPSKSFSFGAVDQGTFGTGGL